MLFKDLHFGTEAKNKLMEGAKKLTEAVAITLGPNGQNVMIQREFGIPFITKDGVTVAKNVFLADPVERMGAEMIKAVASKAADEAGDGTTTATVLARCILLEGNKAIGANINPTQLKKGIDKAVVACVEYLKSISIPCNSKEAIIQVGTISANGEESIGKILSLAYENIGERGTITLEDGKDVLDELKIVEGMEIDRGYISPYFINNQPKSSCELDNPLIFITDKKVSLVRDILPILSYAKKNDRSLLLMAEDVESEAIATMVVNAMKGLKCCAVRAPSFGEKRRELLEDICIVTGSTFLSEVAGRTVESGKESDLGGAQKVIITKDTTTIIGGCGKKEEIEARINQLTQSEKKNEYKDRIAKLSNGVAIIYVGGNSETEMRERKDRLDDALHAIKAAMAEGVVPGGGVALLRCLNALESVSGDNIEQNYGVSIIRKALEAPLRQIAENSGSEPVTILNSILANSQMNYGYDASQIRFGDMIEMGIIDPTKVVRIALQQAASVAGLLITTKCTISINEELKPKNVAPMNLQFD